MQYSYLFALTTLLPTILGAPVDASKPDTIVVDADTQKVSKENLVKVVEEVKAEVINAVLSEPPTSTLVEVPTSNPTNEVFIEPPPIFDPPEPRPETLFDGPLKSNEAPLRPPPIPENRMEHMSPFDGAHAHPDDTPYRPDNTDMIHCSIAMQMLKLTIAVLGLMATIYIIISTCEKMLRCCLRTVRRRRNTVSEEGQIRLDETTIEKAEGSSMASILARSRSASKVGPV